MKNQTIDYITKNLNGECRTIYVKTNSGRTGYVVVSKNKIYLYLEGPNNFWDEGYLHLDEEKNKKNEKDLIYRDLVTRINTLFFAGKMEIENDFFVLRGKNFRVGVLPIKEILKSIFRLKNTIFDLFSERKTKWYQYRLNLKGIRFWKYEFVNVKTDLQCPPLGGTWQKYTEISDWIEEAEKIKNGKIYFA